MSNVPEKLYRENQNTQEKKEPTDDTSKDVLFTLDYLSMFRASLCPSSRDRLNRTASGVSLDVLAAVVCS